ncbi:MAG: CDP-2,3-bis-(O-geranylgeranyl)-sn-glycerol synthase [Candidatus Gastranaerophilales bacterium]|nr:CDP-2,3-bis-(O-geranylgeranyl)-sn-glycerol synthase [Candidatus Gastranaerophilales bacterium]
MEYYTVIIKMIWLMLPAYLSNPAATLIVALTGAGRPIDNGKYIGKERIFGEGKTYKGLFFGIFFGIIVAIIQNLINNEFLNHIMPQFTFIPVITLPTGALLGDLVASFFKRRFGLKRGQPLPLIDQLDFVFGAWTLTYILSSGWFRENFTFLIIIIALILTPVFHLIFNIVGYKIGVKKEPW